MPQVKSSVFVLRHNLLALVCAIKNLAYQTILIMHINLQFCITITEKSLIQYSITTTIAINPGLMPS